MAVVVLDEVIETDYGQFDLGWAEEFGFDGDFDRFFNGQVNGLVGAADAGGVYLNLARRSGGSPVRVVRLDGAPVTITEEWEDVVEVSITIPSDTHPRWSSWAGETFGSLSIPPGTYRLRVSARGRDAGRDGEFADRPVDFYLLELWQAPAAADSILRTGSADAQYWHAQLGGRRR